MKGKHARRATVQRQNLATAQEAREKEERVCLEQELARLTEELDACRAEIVECVRLRSLPPSESVVRILNRAECIEAEEKEVSDKIQNILDLFHEYNVWFRERLKNYRRAKNGPKDPAATKRAVPTGEFINASWVEDLYKLGSGKPMPKYRSVMLRRGGIPA